MCKCPPREAQRPHDAGAGGRLRRLRTQHRHDGGAWPGTRLRPHVKAWKCTALARRLHADGHPGFCCATSRGRGHGRSRTGRRPPLANQVLGRSAARLGTLAQAWGARVTVAVVRRDDRRGGRGRHPGGARRRERRHAPLRLRSVRRRPSRRSRPLARPRGARGHGVRRPPHDGAGRDEGREGRSRDAHAARRARSGRRRRDLRRRHRHVRDELLGD